MEKETKTLNFVEVTNYFIFINIDKNTCFQIGKDNKFYGVDSAVVETELTFERDKGVFEKKTKDDLKNGDVFFFDCFIEDIEPSDIYYIINKEDQVYSHFDRDLKSLSSFNNLPTSFGNDVWILKKDVQNE